MMSQNKNGGDSVGTMYVGCTEEQVFYDDKRNRIRENIGETLKPLYYKKQPLDPIIVWKIYLMRNSMVLMSHQCFP